MPSRKSKSASKPTTGTGRLYTLEVKLIGGPVTEAFVEKNESVSRTIQIRGDQTLENLHNVIFDSFDREEEHLYEFQLGIKRPNDRNAIRYTLSQVAEDSFVGDNEMAGYVEGTRIDALSLKPKQAFFYWFDFGDDWWHEIRVVGISDEVPKGKYPKVVERVGESPPQYPDWDEDGFDEGDDEFDAESEADED